jgi:hypothetical protein
MGRYDSNVGKEKEGLDGGVTVWAVEIFLGYGITFIDRMLSRSVVQVLVHFPKDAEPTQPQNASAGGRVRA